jgi:hypothetical protein
LSNFFEFRREKKKIFKRLIYKRFYLDIGSSGAGVSAHGGEYEVRALGWLGYTKEFKKMLLVGIC